MSTSLKMIYAFSACLFAAIALCSIVAYGGEWARNTAILSSLFACFSQFVAQDTSWRAYAASIIAAYFSFGLLALAFYWLAIGF
ncbi:hypothetical protein [Ochrobactrum sp. SFR4]|uniref:hypothetical protein n=1 Tax=Ochrobactrum sp. SFR4 TaxID=2717368 RepID=UPI001C8BCA17|nr:hypothetical protein [Ochrobactrum sp. SFR4]MBX8825256.1 hypothetical protein [Ochrobactrum sp. SFR4]